MCLCLPKELIQYGNTDVILIAETLKDHTHHWKGVQYRPPKSYTLTLFLGKLHLSASLNEPCCPSAWNTLYPVPA